MSLEEWIMNNLGGIIIGASATIVAAIIANIAAIINSGGNINTNHTERSKEHQGILHGQEKLSKEHNNLKEQQTEIKSMLTFLKDEKNKEIGSMNALRSSQLDIQKIVQQLTALSMEVSELRIENANLKADNAKLTQENTEIKEYISKIRSADFDADEEEM